jgi:hypothetical protein
MFNKFQIVTLLIFTYVSSLHNEVIAKQNCLAIPIDFTVECGEVDWGFIYTNTTGAFAHPCDDINTNIDSQRDLQIQVDSLNCGDLNSPNVVVRISRIFTYGASEQFLLESCKDDNNCDDSVHQANRSTTAKILRPEEKVYIHKVKAGQTLYNLAKSHSVRMRQVKDWNGLKSAKMRVGQDILIYLP